MGVSEVLCLKGRSNAESLRVVVNERLRKQAPDRVGWTPGFRRIARDLGPYHQHRTGHRRLPWGVAILRDQRLSDHGYSAECAGQGAWSACFAGLCRQAGPTNLSD